LRCLIVLLEFASFEGGNQMEYIEHWSRGKKKDNAKYVARIEAGKNADGTHRFRYFYTNNEYNAYLRNLQSAKNKKIDSNANRLKNAEQTRYQNESKKVTAKYAVSDAQKKFDKIDSTVARGAEKFLGRKLAHKGIKTTAQKRNEEKFKAQTEVRNKHNSNLSQINKEADAAKKKNNSLYRTKQAEEKRTAIADKLDKSKSKSSKLKRKVRRKINSTLNKHFGTNLSKIKKNVTNKGKSLIDKIMYKSGTKKIYSSGSNKGSSTTTYQDYKEKRFGKNKGKRTYGATYSTTRRRSHSGK